MTIGDDIAHFKKCFPAGLKVAIPLQYEPVRAGGITYTEVEFKEFDVSELIEKLITEIKNDDKIFSSLKKAMDRS